MTGYMYNPSRKVSELLSRYLEFDPEQLNLGIWSGNLSLTDVSLRDEALYPLLNRHVTAATTTSSSSTTNNESPQNFTHSPPPLRFKLVSGTIGSLEMKIPWKRLVWGPGDVSVTLRNVVLVLALESVEETQERFSSSSTSATTDVVDDHDLDFLFPGVVTADDKEKSRSDSKNPELVRELKQNRLREAERRHLEGRLTATWIESMRKKDQEKIAKILAEGEPGKESLGHLNSWLSSATKDFFWRFCAGLIMTVENVKVVIVQDGVELGVLMPSIRLTNSKFSGFNSHPHEGSEDSDSADIQPHANVVYKGDNDDGENIDKTIKFVGLGVYTRRSPVRLAKNNDDDRNDCTQFAADVSTKEYVVRPVDCSFDYSFFYPHPPEKRKRKQGTTQNDSQDHTATTVETGDGSTTSAGSSKRRRGKRDKHALSGVPSTPGSPSQQRVEVPKSSLNPVKQRRASTVGAMTTFAPSSRRQSIALRQTPQRPQLGMRRTSAASVPLVRPDNIGSEFASAAAGNRQTVRFESKLTIGAVELICSSRHYALVGSLLSCCARVRNGRPSTTIQSVLNDYVPVNRSLTILTHSNQLARYSGHLSNNLSGVRSGRPVSKPSDVEVRLQIHGLGRSTGVVKRWWRYALRAIVWELRERNKLRKKFQQRYLYFSWDSQHHRRQEYVELYISLHLRKTGQLDGWSLSSASNEELLAIEDELPIEQILLYRSIARAIFVRGGQSMPVSILELRDPTAARLPQQEEASAVLTRNNSVVRTNKSSRDIPSFLTMMEKQGEITKARFSAQNFDSLPTFQPYVPPTGAGNRLASVTHDDTTFAHTVDTRAVRLSRRRALQLSQIEEEPEAKSMLVSFVVNVEKLELVLMEDSEFGYVQAPTEDSGSCSSSSGGDNTSDVSVLTDDQRFFRDTGELPSIAESERVDDAPLISSADFLIFSEPENVVLRFSINPLTLSVLARTGGSRNINLKVGRITALSGSDQRFVTIGVGSRAAPISEVGFGAQHLSSGDDEWNRTAPQDALSVALVANKAGNLLECDASTIRVTADLEIVSKIGELSRKTTPKFPCHLLPQSSQEETRLYLLKQNATSLTNVNCSLRLHGVELSIPVHMIVPDSVSDDDSTSDVDEKPSVACRIGMIEVYSGTAVTALGDAADEFHSILNGDEALPMDSALSRYSSKTRTLRMLDVTELTATRSSFLSQHWVFAASGVDCIMNFCPPMYYSWSKMSVFESPVDAEILWTSNANSLGDFNRAKWELLLKFSPIDLILSSSRVDRLATILQTLPVRKQSGAPTVTTLPPRLEVLSQFMVLTCDITVERFRVSLEESEVDDEGGPSLSSQARVRRILEKFLSVVTSFDLSYPNEESLASAMQLSIDQLTGLGITLDDAWEITNTLLLNFLEDCGVTNARQDDAILSSIDRTTSSFWEVIQSSDLVTNDEDRNNYSFVLDVPEGVYSSIVKLYYDSSICVTVPTVFVTDTNGIHLLRVAPPECVATDEQSQLSANVPSNASEMVQDEGSLPVREQAGTTLRTFRFDHLFPFGRGGDPLSALGADGNVLPERNRIRETSHDVEVSEVEVLFCAATAESLMSSLAKVLAPLLGMTPQESKNREVLKSEEHDALAAARTRLQSQALISVSSSSFLFVADDLTPFLRLGIKGVLLKKVLADFLRRPELESPAPSGGEALVSARSLSLINLTREGETYPEILSVLPGSPVPPFVVSISDGLLDIELRGVRLFVLQQYISEILQYFFSGNFGFGSFLKSCKNRRTIVFGEKNSVAPKRRTSIHLRDSSIILPRSTLSSDLVALEIQSAKLQPTRISSSFVLPTDTSGFFLSKSCNTQGSEVSRCVIELRGFRILTALPNNAASQDGTELPSFRFFFAIDGRARAGKAVYIRRESTAGEEVGFDVSERGSIEAGLRRQWQEVTNEECSLDIVVDKAPHLRLLISDPFDGSGLDCAFDMKISQFALLLSIWYSNLQELPVMFPLTARQIEMVARSPSASHSFPEFGSEEFRRLLMQPTAFTTEIAVMLEHISLRCVFDDGCTGPRKESEQSIPPIKLVLQKALAHVTNDRMGVTRIGIGSSFVLFIDEAKTFSSVIQCGTAAASKDSRASFGDLTFGLAENYSKMSSSLSQAFQLSLFMTPGWSLYNLGLQTPVAVMSDFTSIFKLLDFLTRYASDPGLGNPTFEAVEHAKALKFELSKHMLPNGGALHEIEQEPKGNALDFRLWLRSPCVSVPCDEFDAGGPGVRLVCPGLWYHYNSMPMFASHEVVGKELDLLFDDRIHTSHSNSKVRQLVDGLSFGLRLDFNEERCHTDVSFEMPFSQEDACSIISDRLSTKPVKLDPAVICNPFRQPQRLLGPSVCEVTVIIELLPLVSSALSRLFQSPDKGIESDSTTSFDVGAEPMTTSESRSVSEPSGSPVENSSDATFSVAFKMEDFRVFSFDPVLGPHLPVAVLSVARVDVTTSIFGLSEEGPDRQIEGLQLVLRGHIWADYFKLGLTRSWEPLLEAYKFEATYEKSLERGSGVSLVSDSPLHMNVSGALLVILDEVVDSFQRSVAETFGSGNALPSSTSMARNYKPDEGSFVEDFVGSRKLLHEIPAVVESTDRVPFAIRNMTGQEVRLCKESDTGHRNDGSGSLVVSYISNEESTQLSFRPSISVVSNMTVIEIEFPGLPNGRRVHEIGTSGSVAPHAIDIQVPGFQWLQGIKVDTFGRSFLDIVPSSQTVRGKVEKDWRVANTMKLLVEVGLQNGGRQVTIRSIFSICNRTSHRLSLLLNPDSAFEPHMTEGTVIETASEADTVIDPDDVYQVPVLLTESALRAPGSHIGSLWVRPSLSGSLPSFQSFLEEEGEVDPIDSIHVDYTSRPVQLAKMVSESALLFENQQKSEIGQAETKSGVHVSCPVVQGSRRLAPFCYVVEVSRSPLVKAASSTHDTAKTRVPNRVHGPVLYTLSVHPTFVVVNLLPHKGRFELMHAVRRTVLWYADLEPGEQIAVHSVGLDAPLLLFLNLGFCKTPVGEGALVHHGVDPPRGARETLGLKSIGKAGKAVTKQLGRTLTKIGESPDKRGHERMFLVQNPQFLSKGRQGLEQVVANAAKTDLGLNNDVAGVSGVDSTGGKTFRIDTAVFFPSDVAAETIVVDGIGQRLTLNIENVRGGGGQRTISVYSPFWIVNTTEHSLRYRQEKSSTSFPSGTVSSPEKDGSVPLEGGRAEANYGAPSGRHLATERVWGTVFSGMPGALASSPGRCDLRPDEVASLVDADLPLEKLAELAFMFNFSEGVLSLGNQKLCMQLWDGTGVTAYASDWSQGFSLDSVGFSQVVGMHCKDGRTLELTVIVTVAPGHLSGYSKVVRIVSRFFVVNALPYPIRLWQDSSVFRPPGVDNSGEPSSKEQKWHLMRDKSGKGFKKVNQYEALWGRETVLDDGHAGAIPGGSRAHPSALYIASVGPSEVVPFTLPDSRGERQLRLDLGGYWNLTSSVSADIPGEHTVKATKGLDLKMIPHVSTRGSPEYNVTIRQGDTRKFGCELGVWFETEWGNDRKLIVKAVKKESFSFQETDVHVGDELLCIDDEPVSRMSFGEAMGKLRARLNAVAESAKVQDSGARQMRRSSLRLVGLGPKGPGSSMRSESGGVPSLVLRFRTVEERLRRVRLKAARANDQSLSENTGLTINNSDFPSPIASAERDPGFLKVDLRAVQHSFFLVVREQNSVPYQIHNRTISSTIYYRQKSCDGHPWQSLKPGQSAAYAWEEPLRSKRLVVRVATALVPWQEEDSESEASTDDSGRRRRQVDKKSPGNALANPFTRKVKDEEDSVFSPSIIVRLEEIGFKDFLPCIAALDEDDSKRTKYLELDVEVQGSTRVLVVQDASTDGGLLQLERQIDLLKARQCEEELRLEKIQDMKILADGMNDEVSSGTALTSLIEGFSDEPMISACHQLVVEVLEANGLSSDSFAGSCNPYAEVYLKCAKPGRLSMFRKRDVRRTYFVKKTVSPIWKSQSFVFNVPPEAVTATRGYSAKIRLRDYRVLGNHKLLGATQVELHSLRDQSPLVGWFPLAGRTGRHELENPLSHWGRGSIKLRLQWIFTPLALMEYFILLSERQLLGFQESLEGLLRQLSDKRDAEVKRKEEMDGFQKVRIRDMLTMSSNARKPTSQSIAISNRTEFLASPFRGLPSLAEESHLPGSDFAASLLERSPVAKKQADFMTPPLRTNDVGKSPSRKQLALKSKVQAIELLINHTRQNFSNRRLSLGDSHDGRKGGKLTPQGLSGAFAASSFKSWSAAQALFRDPDFLTSVDGDEIKIRTKTDWWQPRKAKPNRPLKLSEKFVLPRNATKSMTQATLVRADSFDSVRKAFSRAAERKIKSVLHPGGWLIVRPITALNLPEAFTGMFVKVRFGRDILVTESVDAKVNPSWDVSNEPARQLSVAPGRRRKRSRPTLHDATCSDLHIRVAPQKTSGSIILSVVGEKSHPNLHSKTEVGVLHLPLGATIAACLDSGSEPVPDTSIPKKPEATYKRWFPLMTPTDVVPVEGDLGLSYRPRETEKASDNCFHEYFAPCILLALSWLPDSENTLQVGNIESDTEPRRRSVTVDSPQAGSSRGRHHHTPPLVTNYFLADVGRISTALIDSQRAFELVSASASDIELRYWKTKAKTRMGVSVGWLQIDQQHDDAREPVILAPTPSDCLSPVIQVLAVQDNTRSMADVVSFDFIDVSIEEFDLTLEENILFDLFDFITSVKLRRGLSVRRATQPSGDDDPISRSRSDQKHSLMHSGGNEDRPEFLSVIYGSSDGKGSATKVYIEQLFLGVVKINLSYLKGKRQTWELTSNGWVEKGSEGTYRVRLVDLSGGERLFNFPLLFHEKSEVMMKWSLLTSDDDREAESNGKLSPSFPQLFASLFPNISDAPIRLQGKALNHIFESPNEILQSIQKYYVNETLRQVYRIIGSLDFVGNPTMLFTSFFSGVRDLVMTPSKAFMRSPTDASGVGIGVAKGTISLFSHSTSGFFGFWAKVSAAAGQGLTWLTLDPDYRTWHRDKIVVEATNLNRVWKRRGVQSLKATVARPVLDIFLGVGGAVSGFFIMPVKGYRRGGGSGLLLGVVGGTAGIVVKPVVGVLDAMAHFTASIHDIAKSVNVLDKRLQPALRLRLPYTFGIVHILTPFSQVSARAANLLRRYPVRKTRLAALSSPETLVHVEVLPNVTTDTYIIVSSCRVTLFRLRREPSGALSPSFGWEVSLSDGSKVSSRVSEHGHSGIVLTVTVSKPPEDDPLLIKPVAVDEGDIAEQSAEFEGESREGPIPQDGDTPLQSHYSVGDDAEGQYHGTARGDEGELLEWFSVLAEYQYRPQLARIHNAISCLSGEFASIIHDPSLGRTWSTEGFTSFGIYHFQPESPTEKTQGGAPLSIVSSLNRLSWVDKWTVAKLRQMDVESQRPYLDNLRERCDYNDILDTSRKMGGPNWFVLARAEALYADSIAPTPPQGGTVRFEETPETPQNVAKPKKMRRWASTPLPPIPDGRILETASEMLQFISPFKRETTPDSKKEAAPSKSRNSTETVESAVPSFSVGSGHPASPDDNAFSSFATAAEPSEEMQPYVEDSEAWEQPTPPSGSGRAVLYSSQSEPRLSTSDSYRTAREALARSSISTFYSLEPGSEVLPPPPTPPPASLPLPHPFMPPLPPPSSLGGGWGSSELEVHTRYRRHEAPPPPPPRDDRLERMERLMEGLLLLASEQALHTATVTAAAAAAATVPSEPGGGSGPARPLGTARSTSGRPYAAREGAPPPLQPHEREIAALRAELASLEEAFLTRTVDGGGDTDAADDGRGFNADDDESDRSASATGLLHDSPPASTRDLQPRRPPHPPPPRRYSSLDSDGGSSSLAAYESAQFDFTTATPSDDEEEEEQEGGERPHAAVTSEPVEAPRSALDDLERRWRRRTRRLLAPRQSSSSSPAPRP